MLPRFSQHIEDTLASNAKSIAIGGRPDVTSKIQAYTQLRLCRQGQWLVPNLEVGSLYAHQNVHA